MLYRRPTERSVDLGCGLPFISGHCLLREAAPTGIVWWPGGLARWCCCFGTYRSTAFSGSCHQRPTWPVAVATVCRARRTRFSVRGKLGVDIGLGNGCNGLVRRFAALPLRLGQAALSPLARQGRKTCATRESCVVSGNNQAERRATQQKRTEEQGQPNW